MSVQRISSLIYTEVRGIVVSLDFALYIVLEGIIIDGSKIIQNSKGKLGYII